MERKKKFIKATIFGVIFIIIYFLLEQYLLNKQGHTLSQAMRAYPIAFIWHSFEYFCFGVSLIYGYPIVRDWLSRILSGCVVHILFYIWVLALAASIGAFFGWILYFIDLYHIIRKHPDSSEVGYYEEISQTDNEDSYSDVNQENDVSNQDSDEELQDALKSIDSFKIQ